MKNLNRLILLLVLSATVFGVSLISSPDTAFAQRTLGISISDLRLENGWVCDTGMSSCRNNTTDQTSRWYRATASCTVTILPSTSAGGEDRTRTTCVATLRDGSSVSGTRTSDVATAGVEASGEERDENGNLISSGAATLSAEDQGGGGNGVTSCGISNILQPWTWFECGVRAVAWVILGVASLFLYIAGLLLNAAMVHTVFGFSTLIGNSPQLLAAWSILRDIGNMLLLFGFIFIGIAMILNLESYAAKKTLPKLIIFAILMNFSLFIAGAVIDVSNGLSSALYTQSRIDPACSSENIEQGSSFADCAVKSGVSSRLMEATGISSIYSIEGITGDVAISTSGYFGLIMFATIATVVLFAAAIMLIIRAVVLTGLMIVAPLGFAALAIPPLEKVGRDWWTLLLHQSFFAPILLLLILVTLKVTESFATAETRGGLAGALSNGNTGAISVFLIFALVIGFLIFSLVAAKKFGAIGASFAVNTGAKFAFGGLTHSTNLAVGGAAFGLKRLQQKTGAGGKFGKFVANRGLRRLSNANLDLRRLPGAGAALGLAGATAGAKPSEHASFTDMKHRYEEIRDNKKGKEREAEYQKEIATDRLVEELRTNSLSPESERFLAGLSAEEIAANHDLQHNMENLAERLSPDQFEGMMKSDKADQALKNELSEARFDQVRNAVEQGYDSRDVVRNLSNKDLEMLAKHNPGLFNELILIEDADSGDGMLSNDQAESLGKSSSLTNTQRSNVRVQTKVGRVEAAVSRGASANAQQFASTMASKAKAKLNATALTDDGVIATFTPGDLAEIQREGKLTPAEVTAVATAVKDASHANSATINDWLDSTPNARGYWN